MRLPAIFYPVMKFVVPILLIVILIKGIIDDMIPRILFMQWRNLDTWSKETASAGERLMYEFGLAGRQLVESPEAERAIYHWGARIEMLLLYALFIVLVAIAWRRRGRRGPEGANV